MSDKSSLKWHEIINTAADESGLAFVGLYREYATALHEKQREKQAAAFWPFPRT